MIPDPPRRNAPLPFSWLTNATAEGFNSRVQSIKSAARGFRNFENYRTRILFYCGKLDLMPIPTH